nr:reverse transcriptase domain-containing protein [Tanacetum cinerariifolium]
VAKVSTSSSTLAISFEVAELKDMVRALLLDKKNQSSAPTPSLIPASIKAVEPNYVTCGGTLPSNTITNPKEDLKGITTRSGVAYKGPTIPTPSKVVKPGTEPVVSPVSVSMPNLKPSIPYPSRRDNERRRDQANEQIEKFYEIFKDMSFKFSFTDALTLMPKFASTLKALIGNKEKLSEMARTPMNEHCSALILNKFPRKLGDPGKFFIPCEFPGMDEYLELADLGASINLMPLSVWEGLSLPELTPTCMTLDLVDRSVSRPIGIAKDVSVKTGRALIDVHKGKLTLRIGNEAITYNLDQTSRYSANYNQMTATKLTLLIWLVKNTLKKFLVSLMLPRVAIPLLMMIRLFPQLLLLSLHLGTDPEGDILLLEAILNSEPLPPLPTHEQYMPSFKKELKVCEAKTVKSSIDEPPEVKLKDLPPHLELAGNKYYCFLDGFFGYFYIPIDPRDQEKTTFTCPYGTFAYNRMPFGLCNAPGTFQRCMLAIFHDMVEKTMEVFMDNFSVFGNSFENCLSRLDKMLQRCEDTNLCLNWEKSHFMVKEGIVLDHKISKNGI